MKKTAGGKRSGLYQCWVAGLAIAHMRTHNAGQLEHMLICSLPNTEKRAWRQQLMRANLSLASCRPLALM